MERHRRSFLKAGTVAALVLAAGGGIYRMTRPAQAQPFALDGEARAALQAIVPAILAGALSEDPQQRAHAIAATVERVHQAILGLPPATQKEVQDLFGLLVLSPVRRLLAGVTPVWSEARENEVAAFLQDWRSHGLGLLRTAYQALHDLVLGAWYSDPVHWAAIGYPGPPEALS